MYRISGALAVLLAIAVDPALASAQGNRNPAGQARQSYEEHDRDTRFAVTTDAGGNAVFTIRGGDFLLEKIVAPSGDTTLRLSQGRDIVTIALSQSGFQVARGRRTVRFDPRSGDGDKLDAVRSLLLGSRAVRSFRRLAASIEGRDEAEEDGPLALSALVDGAIVHLLDGDTEAPGRIARRVSRKQRAALRPAAATRAPDMFRDCIGLYQFSLLDAYGRFETCWVEATDTYWWSSSYLVRLCEWEWAIRAQQYIWQFVGCLALPF